jgi:hypothetical protein
LSTPREKITESLMKPRSHVAELVVEEWISVGTFRAKEKITATPQQVVNWTFAKEPDADY